MKSKIDVNKLACYPDSFSRAASSCDEKYHGNSGNQDVPSIGFQSRNYAILRHIICVLNLYQTKNEEIYILLLPLGDLMPVFDARPCSFQHE